jgi:MFS family permease
MFVGFLTALLYFSELVGSPIAGFLVDRRGIRPLLLAGPILGVLANALIAGPTRMGVVAVARLLQGLSTACTVPAALAFLSDATFSATGQRSRAMSFFEVSSIGGIAAGYVVGGLLWDWLRRPGFWMLTAVYGLSIGIFLFIRVGKATKPVHRGDSFAAIRQSLDLMPSWLALNAVAGIWFGQAAYQFSGANPRVHQILTAGLPERQIGVIFGVYVLLFALGTITWGLFLNRISLHRALRIGCFGLMTGAVAILGINHSDQLGTWGFQVFLVVGVLALAAETAFTPAALILLAARSDTIRQGRGAVMGVYSMLLAGGQLIGSLVGGVSAQIWGVDGLVFATAMLGVIGYLTLPRESGGRSLTPNITSLDSPRGTQTSGVPS